jgi:excisionase family DNA binding protein
MEESRKLLSIIQAPREVGASRRTIYNWLHGGRLEFVRTAGGNVRIYRDSLWRPGTLGTHKAQTNERANQ